MKLTFKQPYQSITSLFDTEINDFAIITGLNGSGKTHLLNAINTGHIEVQGIDPSQILLYNYNNFTIYNVNATRGGQSEQIQKVFSDKSNQSNHTFGAEIAQVLSLFQPEFTFEAYKFDESSFLHISNFNELTNWTDADYEFYASVLSSVEPNEPSSVLQSFTGYQRQLFDQIGYEPVSNIRDFIKAVKSFKTKSEAMKMIRSSGYLKTQIQWDNEELVKLLTDFDEAVNKDSYFQLLRAEPEARLNEPLLAFLQSIRSVPGLFENLTLAKALELKEAVCSLLPAIEEHFEKTMDPHSLNIIRAMNRGEILSGMPSESGFLNLNDITLAEKSYQIQKKVNEFAEFQSYKVGKVDFLSPEEFVRQNGLSPVDTLNSVLNVYDCNGYEFKQSELHMDLKNGINAQQVDISLYNKVGDYRTTLDALSSGERTLLALAFTIYKLKRRRVIAKLFLMDEIDSALHPSMSKRLLNVLYDLFYREMGINIIISTHSPSTVAFAPRHSTYIMRRDQQPRLVKASKDAALAELTAGVPSFSVNYENRRQIFVESKYDAEYYEALYVILKDRLDQEVSLNFISSGDAETGKNGMGKSNCTQVIKITGILREAGNKSIWGIIDWDLTNDETNFGVKVLGYNQRYSIESYLLDPLLIGMLLLREKYVDAETFGLNPDTKYHNVTGFDSPKLQLIVNKVIEKLGMQIDKAGEDYSTYLTIGGKELLLPKSFTTCQGHKLEDQYLKAFPRLNDIKRDREWMLKETVIKKVIADFSELAPMELLDILKQVQEI